MDVSKTLMLVEDENQQRETLTMLFEVEGYKVISVESAEEALAHLENHRPGMIITDIKLTGMDGLTLFETVRKNTKVQDVPFIFITAYNDRSAMERAKNLGAFAYVTKPYNLEDLLAIVKQSLPAA